MFSQTRVFELDRLLLLLFLLLLSSLLSKFLNTILLVCKACSAHLIILTSIIIVIIVFILLVHIFVTITFHIGIKPLVLVVIVGGGVLHHTVDGCITRISTFLSFNVSSYFFLDPLFFLVKLRRLVLAYLAH